MRSIDEARCRILERAFCSVLFCVPPDRERLEDGEGRIVRPMPARHVGASAGVVVTVTPG